MAVKLTDRIIKGLEPPSPTSRGRYKIVYDSEISGFCVRVMRASKDAPSGTRAFVMNYRFGGRERRYTIGKYPAWSVAAARKEAGDLRKEIDRGKDIMGERHRIRQAPTIADLAVRYVEEHLPKKRPTSQRGDKTMLGQVIVPNLGKTRVADIRHADIDALHRSLKATPYQANRMVALLSKMFNLAIKWEMRMDNPAKGIERYAEDKRERYLDGDERARLLVAMQDHTSKGKSQAQTVNAFRLAMLTGARIGECLSAQWDHFDLRAAIWIKPSSLTKTKKSHRITLNSPALALLSEIDRASDWIFPNTRGDGPQKDYKYSWAAIIKAAKIDNLRVHDLRHNFASEGVAAGLSLPMIGALLGHTNPATTARYAHLMDDPMRQATERIGSRLTADNALAERKDGVS